MKKCFWVKKINFSDCILGCSCEPPLGTTRLDSHEKALWQGGEGLTKSDEGITKGSTKSDAGMLKKPAAEPGPGKKTGGKKAPFPENKVEEEGEEEEVFSEDQVVAS